MRVIALLLSVLALFVQQKTVPKVTEKEIDARVAAHKSDFDYLLGQWTFDAVSKRYGKFEGLWSAVKLPGGQVMDEYAIRGDKGEKMYASTTIRAYNAVLDQWELVGMDGGNGLNDMGTGRRDGGEVHIEQTFGVMSQTPATWRIRYFNIKADSFSWRADVSNDGGKTWTKDFQTIEAKRAAAPRTVEIFPPAPKR